MENNFCISIQALKTLSSAKNGSVRADVKDQESSIDLFSKHLQREREKHN